MTIHIKNMCCPRCINAVRTTLISMNLTIREVNLGDAAIEEELTSEQKATLSEKLQDQGFELLDDPLSCIVEDIRRSVILWVRMKEDRPKLSDYLSSQLGRDYSSLSKLFSQVRGVTIEHYAIQHRVEYAKELLCYSQISVSEIAYRLGYSSPAHFAAQFKQHTGMSPKAFREMDDKKRNSLDEL